MTWVVTVAFDDGSTQEYGQIIEYDHYHVYHWYGDFLGPERISVSNQIIP